MVAVGRFPAETPAHVETMVRKAIEREETGLASVSILSDDQAGFGRFADDMQPLMPTTASQPVHAVQSIPI